MEPNQTQQRTSVVCYHRAAFHPGHVVTVSHVDTLCIRHDLVDTCLQSTGTCAPVLADSVSQCWICHIGFHSLSTATQAIWAKDTYSNAYCRCKLHPSIHSHATSILSHTKHCFGQLIKQAPLFSYRHTSAARLHPKPITDPALLSPLTRLQLHSNLT